MAEIKTIQLPVEVWEQLKELAQHDERTIVSYTRKIIKELHKQTFATDKKKA